MSHDQIQRLLAKERFGSAELWQVVKPYVRQMQQEDGVISIDDSIAEKPYSDENDIICWHYDHSQDRSVKGINFSESRFCPHPRPFSPTPCWKQDAGFSLSQWS